MRKDIFIVMSLLALAAMARPAIAAESAKLDTAKIEELTGAKGKLDEKEGAFKVSVPRSDLSVTAAGVRLTPPMGLTSWAAFKRAGAHTMVMGDTVLLEDQVNPVMSVALDNGLEVTALHNHFFWDTPKVMFMHIGGMGDEASWPPRWARSSRRSRTPAAGKVRCRPPTSIRRRRRSRPRRSKRSWVRRAISRTACTRSSSAGRPRCTRRTIGNTMGVNTWAAFAGSDDKAVVDGDFAMLETELQGVLKALARRRASTSWRSTST